MKTQIDEHKQLAQLIYNKGLKEELHIQLRQEYLKRIDYLVDANNELMRELEQCEQECYGIANRVQHDEDKEELAQIAEASHRTVEELFSPVAKINKMCTEVYTNNKMCTEEVYTNDDKPKFDW